MQCGICRLLQGGRTESKFCIARRFFALAATFHIRQINVQPSLDQNAPSCARASLPFQLVREASYLTKVSEQHCRLSIQKLWWQSRASWTRNAEGLCRTARKGACHSRCKLSQQMPAVGVHAQSSTAERPSPCGGSSIPTRTRQALPSALDFGESQAEARRIHGRKKQSPTRGRCAMQAYFSRSLFASVGQIYLSDCTLSWQSRLEGLVDPS